MIIILPLYVDDLLVPGGDVLLEMHKSKLTSRSKMTDMRLREGYLDHQPRGLDQVHAREF